MFLKLKHVVRVGQKVGQLLTWFILITHCQKKSRKALSLNETTQSPLLRYSVSQVLTL